MLPNVYYNIFSIDHINTQGAETVVKDMTIYVAYNSFYALHIAHIVGRLCNTL